MSGVGKGRKLTGSSGRHHQLISFSRKTDWYSHSGKECHLVTVYFPLNGDQLDPADRRVLAIVATTIRNFLSDGHRVQLKYLGYADARGSEGYNVDLSRRRINAVAFFLKGRIGPGLSWVETKDPRGEKFSSSNRLQWANDRRVDLYMTMTLKKEESNYKFDQWANNQNLLRPMIFKHYYPQYWLWRNRRVEYLVDIYEDEDRRGGSGQVSIRSTDYDLVMEIVEQLADYNDYKRIEQWAKTRDRKKIIETAYGVEYRKAYQVAYQRAYQAFERSDFRYPWEFFAIEFGLVPKNTPYTKRPGRSAQAGKLGDKYEYSGKKSH